MFAKDQIIEIFFKLDEFWKKFSHFSPKSIGQTDRKKRHYHRDGKMSVPEIMLIMILFHSSGYRCLKHFYLNEVCGNMKGSILSAGDSLLIRKRAIIESVNDELKNIAQVEHSRHRSLHNFLVNMMSAISAYCLFPKKPSIRLEPVSDTESCRQLCLF